jgi:hypothetical protein
MDVHQGIAYRLAYGQATELAAAGAALEQILAEVLRRLRFTDVPELLREAVEDGLAGRRPRW